MVVWISLAEKVVGIAQIGHRFRGGVNRMVSRFSLGQKIGVFSCDGEALKEQNVFCKVMHQELMGEGVCQARCLESSPAIGSSRCPVG